MHSSIKWLVLILIASVIGSSSCSEPFYLNSELGTHGGNGSHSNPFSSFQDLNAWIGVYGLQSCSMTLSLASGTYTDPNLPSSLPYLSIEPNSRALDRDFEFDSVFIEFSANASLFTSIGPLNAHIRLHNLHFRPSSLNDFTFTTAPLISARKSRLDLFDLTMTGFRRNSSLISISLDSSANVTGMMASDNELYVKEIRAAYGTVFGGLGPHSISISSSFIFNNSLVADCHAVDATKPALISGGAIFASGPLVIFNSTLRSNSVLVSNVKMVDNNQMWACGGAVVSNGETTEIQNSKFESNRVLINGQLTSQSLGGAICTTLFGSSKITGTVFNSNQAGIGAGISEKPSKASINPMDSHIANLLISHSNFTRNQCSIRGCAISWSPISHSDLSVKNSNFVSNYITCPSQIRSSSETYGNHNQLSNNQDFIDHDYWMYHQNMQKEIPNEIASTDEKLNRHHRESFAQLKQKPTIKKSDKLFGIGGVAIAMVVQQTFLDRSSSAGLDLSDLVFDRNFDGCGKNTIDGAVLMLRRPGSVKIERIQVNNHFQFFNVHSLFEIRQATFASLSDVSFRNNTLFDVLTDRQNMLDIVGSTLSWPSSIPSPTPLQNDLKSLRDLTKNEKRDQEAPYALEIEQLHLEDNLARDSLVNIYSVPSMVVRNSNLTGNRVPPIDPSLIEARRPFFMFSIGGGRLLRLQNLHVHDTELPSQITTLSDNGFIEDCVFERFQSSSLSFLSISQNRRFSIYDSTFKNNLGTPIMSAETGLTITNSFFESNSSPFQSGAISISGGNVFFVDISFKNNSGLNGGAISTSATTQMLDCRFDDNVASGDGGAIHTISSHFIDLERVQFNQNQAGGSGGGLFFGAKEFPFRDDQPSSPSELRDVPFLAMLSCNMTGNSASTGGSIALSGGINSSLFRCLFSSNKASVMGGAVSIKETVALKDDDSSSFSQTGIFRSMNTSGYHFFSNCDFLNNSACITYDELLRESETDLGEQKTIRPNFGVAECGGGAISGVMTQLRVYNSRFEFNAAGASGGAISGLSTFRTLTEISRSYFHSNAAGITGGAIDLSEGRYLRFPENQACYILIQHSQFINNLAAFGGAMGWAPAWTCQDNSLENKTMMTNVYFESNWATESGGAVYAAFQGSSSDPMLYTYNNLSFHDNTAFTSGGTFFYNPETSLQQPSVPQFCLASLNCAVSHTPLAAFSEYVEDSITSSVMFNLSRALHGDHDIDQKNRKTREKSTKFSQNRPAPLWGPTQASSRWVANFDVQGAEGPIWQVAGVDLTYHFEDMFGQVVTEPLTLGATVTSLNDHMTPRDANGSIAPIGYSNGVIHLSLAVNKSLSRDPNAAWIEGELNPFEQPVLLHGVLSVTPTSYGRDLAAYDIMKLQLTLALSAFSCEKGEGLWPIPSEPDLVSCAPCPLGTYNLAADGQCYSCRSVGAQGGAAEVKCQRANVTAVTGFWTSEELSSDRSNRLFVTKCLPGFCVNGGCVQGRRDVLCGDCIEGRWETLFSACARDCKTPVISFLLLVAIAILLGTICFHYGLQVSPRATLHVTTTLALGAIFLAPHLDRAVPLRVRFLAAFACGFRANAIQRALFKSFLPYTALIYLLIAFIVHITLRKCLPAFIATATHPRRIARSAFGILFILIIPASKFAIESTQCIQTPLGSKWIFGPKFDCHSPTFSNYRLISTLVLGVLVILPSGLAVVLMISLLMKRPLKFLDLFQLFIDPLDRPHALVTTLLDFIARIIIVIVYSAVPNSIDVRSIVIGGILSAILILHSLMTSATSLLERIAVAVSYSLLAILIVSDPLLDTSTTYPLIASGIFFLWLVGLIICLMIARRYSIENKDVDSTWQDYDQYDVINPHETEKDDNLGSEDSFESDHDHIPLLGH